MKLKIETSLTKLGCLLLLTLLTFSARAYVILQDNFNYANGPLTNVSADVWSGAPSDASGSIGVTNNAVILPGTSTTDQPRTYFTSGISANVVGFTINAPVPPVPAYFFPSNAPVAALYYSFTMTEVGPVPTTSTYISFFLNTNFTYVGRLYVMTNSAAPGNYRLGIANGSSPNPATNIVQTDLSMNTPYTVVVRYVLSSGLATLWVSPTSEANTSPTVMAAETQATSVSLGGNTNSSICGIGLRNAAGEGTVAINSLVAGTTFGDVLPASIGSNPPFIITQPQDNPSAIVGDTISYTTFAGGDTNITYQWYGDTNNSTILLAGQTNTTLTFVSASTSYSGTYSCIASNSAGTVTTRSAVLTVFAVAVAPSISTQPLSQTNNVGDTATFTVTASGVPPPGYQWFYVTNSAGTLKTNAIAGATTATYFINNISNNISGNAYYTTVTNRAGTNLTVKAVLTVNPVQIVNIATIRSMVDGSYNPTNTTSIFTIQGTVTTWTNMTGTANTEFYLQDSTAGMCIFWSGANSTNRPAAGSIVKVTGPLSSFDGLLEVEPVFTNAETSVTVVSTNNPLPTPQALPFDPNATLAQLKALESCYCVASNVYLTAGSTFGSGVNESITNNNNLVLTDPIPGFTFTNAAGETFDIYVNADTAIPGQAVPSGPVTIYGVLGYFGSGVSGFEFTPSRYADIVSYTHVTNYLSNIVRWGDALTNSYTSGALPPAETLTTFASIGDAAGGSVTLTPDYTGLPASASWSNITNGLAATAIFHFTPAPGDAGSNYVVNLSVASTSGTLSTYSFSVYVPTPDEQQMAITEFLADPTTNTSSPLFNPLARPTDTTAVAANDQYVEFANQSPDSYDMQGGFGWDLDSGNPNIPFENFDGLAFDPFLISSNAIVVYGGVGSASPNLPSGVGSVSSSGGLVLPATGTGVIILRDGNGNIVDRVVYNAGTLPTNCSLSRFPTINSPFVPQAYISTNVATAGLQYDGGSWGLPTKVPAPINGVTLSITNKQAVLKFTANTKQANTLWSAGSLTAPFSVVNGGEFGTSSGSFSVTNLPATYQFFFITTQ